MDWNKVKHFKKDEFACKCGCGDSDVSMELVVRLDNARSIAGVPFKITSGKRCEQHNRKVTTCETPSASPHLNGHAADIYAEDSRTRFKILDGVKRAGFTRIGIGKDFIHVDCDPTKADELVWLYN